MISIATIQIACLCFGTWTVYLNRPIAVFYVDGQFLAKSQTALEIHNINSKEIFKFGDKTPVWIYIDLPEGKKEREKLLARQIYDGLIYTKIHRYQSYTDNLSKVFKEAIEPDSLEQNIIQNMTDDGLIYYYSARYGDGYIEIDKKTGAFINIH